MMKYRKAGSAALALILAAGLAACGGTARSGETAPAESPAESAATAADSAAAAAEAQAAAEAAAAESAKAAAEEAARAEREAAEAAAKKARELGAYRTYLDLLLINEEMIGYYDWQDIKWTDEGAVKREEPSAIAFADLCGDEVPELLYMKAADGSWGEYYTASLTIASADEDGAHYLYRERLDAQAAGGTFFSLFTDTEGTLWLYRSIGDEGTEYSFDRFVSDGGTFALEEYLSESVYPNADYTGTVETYRMNGEETSAEAYADAKKALLDSLHMELISSSCDDEALAELASERGNASLTWGAAVSFLEDALAEEDFEPASVDAAEVIAMMPNREFYFASGAGGWGTELTVHEDGTFYGCYHDSDMGTTGEGYPYGTVYESDFPGRFGKMRKVDATTWICDDVTFEQERPSEEEEIEDGIRYVFTEPYGFTGGEHFVIFLPDTETAMLPETALMWYRTPRALGNELPERLGCSGIYNLEEKNGFFSGAE